MKKIIALIATAMVATASFGWVSISWNADEGFLSAYDKNIGYALDDANTTRLVWDLVYTTGSSVASRASTGPTYDKKSAESINYGSDVVLSRRIWEGGETMTVIDNPYEVESLTSDKVSTTPVDVESAGYISGTDGVYKNGLFDPSGKQLYAAVFQTLANGDIYYTMTALTTIKGWDGTGMTPTPEDLNFGVDYEDDDAGVYGKKIDGLFHQTVPEPATMSLLGLGALAMVIRRKLRK